MLTIRPAGFTDAEPLWRLANDPAVRAASWNRASIPWDTHVTWLLRTVDSSTARLYVGYVGAQFVGQARLDRSSSGITVSVSVAREERGKGYGLALIQRMTEKASSWAGNPMRSRPPRLWAEVMDGNTASCRAFEKAGYIGSLDTEAMVWRYSR